ncbi:Hint domain-containing protein [Yoonia sp.]|uniref:Hint domain-containing protein n=1 Tax=Yoonia sp. TaxID=2212373 RepID=UPI001A04F177|nr:Hint domain-containing protein [Yoonia sp.]MBE0414479.1 Hint domain-containing protein [Yoonia sp.]
MSIHERHAHRLTTRADLKEIPASGLRRRRYDIAYLSPNGAVEHMSHMAPALAVFEDAFGALGHSALVQTTSGNVAVEDLMPGDRIRLANGQFETLLWHGTMTLHPNAPGAKAETCNLTRIMADAFGYLRPSPDLVLGPTARLFHKANGMQALIGKDAAFIPAQDFVDGANIINLRPAGAVNVYQLGFASQQRVPVNGLEIESLHPGTAFSHGLRGEMLALYLSLFPHVTSMDGFGLMQHPRLRLRDLDLLDRR